MTERLILTGANGVVGSELVRHLAADPPEAEVVGVFSGPASHAAFRERLGDEAASLVRPVLCDLADAASVAALAAELRPARRTVTVHAAASVAWDRPKEEIWGPNVEATRAIAGLTRRTSREGRIVYVSSAYANVSERTHRNTYEASKAAAEALLHREFADLRPVTLACSLVAGATTDGHVDGFHGIYPLLRLVANGAPFLVGSRTSRIDIVPVDWVAAELLAVIRDVWAGRRPADVVAAAGERSLPLTKLVDVARAAVNALRAADGDPPLGEVPVLSFRQFRFLRRSLDAWGVEGVDRDQIARFERLLDVYEPYLHDSAARPPANVRSPAPSPADYLDRVVAFWWRSPHRRRRRAGAPPLVGA